MSAFIKQNNHPRTAWRISNYRAQRSGIIIKPAAYRQKRSVLSLGLIIQDVDDNEFVDCAIAANADFIITNDRHFRELKDTEFPNLRLFPPKTFSQK